MQNEQAAFWGPEYALGADVEAHKQTVGVAGRDGCNMTSKRMAWADTWLQACSQMDFFAVLSNKEAGSKQAAPSTAINTQMQ